MYEADTAQELWPLVSDGRIFDSLILKHLGITGTAESSLAMVLDGSTTGVRMPRGVVAILMELRKNMATPAGGAWFAAECVFQADGTYAWTFDYDTRPQWKLPLDSDAEKELFQIELRRFPRSAEAMPEWLREIAS
jgi:hypothetical protein